MSEICTLEGFLLFQDLFVVEGADVGLTLHGGERLKPVRCLKDDEDELVGDNVCRRAEELKGNRSLADGFYLLDNQDGPFGEFPEFIRILLPGTRLRGSDGQEYMAELFYDGDRWSITYLPFDYKHDKDDYFACIDE